MRSTAELFIYMDVHRAMEDGVIFYRSKNDVILTIGHEGWLAAKYFLKAVRIDYNTCEIEEMEFDREIEAPKWAAEMAPIAPSEGNSYVVKNLEALIANCRKRLQEINEIKAMQENGEAELSPEDLEKVSKHAQVYTELQSLEQRFRQHKGHRRENAQEREARAKEEAEACTVVDKKDRKMTPPWERGRSKIEEAGSKAMQVTEKEKAEWAALGKRREGATAQPREPVPKKEDPWEKMAKLGWMQTHLHLRIGERQRIGGQKTTIASVAMTSASVAPSLAAGAGRAAAKATRRRSLGAGRERLMTTTCLGAARLKRMWEKVGHRRRPATAKRKRKRRTRAREDPNLSTPRKGLMGLRGENAWRIRSKLEKSQRSAPALLHHRHRHPPSHLGGSLMALRGEERMHRRH
jgi:hypothetical protein